MADLGSYSDKLLQDDPNNPNGQAQAGSGTVSSGTSGVVGSGNTGAPVSTAGVGAGGVGGWTNIQAYLNANQGDNGSAKNLQDKAGSTYNNEATNLQTQADTTKNQAQGEANKISDAKDHSDEWVNQAANAYSYTGNQNQDYQGNVGKLKTALTGQYAGPNSFAYQNSEDFEKNKSALGNDGAFNNYMNDIYKQKAGGQLNQGEADLQTQLDVNNQPLTDARQNLLKQYAGFGDQVNKTATDTDAAIQQARTQYGNNQAALGDYLQGLGNNYQTAENKAENDARDSYNTDLTTGQSGLGSFMESQAARPNQYISEYIDRAKAANAYGDGHNLTWEQIQNEKNLNKPEYDTQLAAGNAGVGGMPYLARNFGALDGFYNNEDQKYSGAGDSEKKHWNTITDILNSNAEKKKQGFAVRG